MDAKRNDSAADREIVLTRVLDAPRELVWEVMTNPEHVVHWWGPRGFTTTTEKMDVRPGGVWKHVMHGPDGTDYPNSSVFSEVVRPERIVYAHGCGKRGESGTHFEANWTFEALGDKTRIRIRMLFDSAADREFVIREYDAIEGGKQTLDRLGEHLAAMSAPATTDRDFVISRVFDAPRELVFNAFTDPQHMQHWWGPKGLTVIASRMDLRPGGTYHYGMKAPDGGSMWGKFVYREIVVPERLVFVNSFSDEAGGVTRHPMSPTWPLELLSTLTFDPHASGTRLTIRWALLSSATDEERRTWRYAAGLDRNAGPARRVPGECCGCSEMTVHAGMQVEIAGNDPVFTRIFDAPRVLVFQAWTDPKHLSRWWGPHIMTCPVCKVGLRPGGRFRIVMRGPDGVDYPLTGVYRRDRRERVHRQYHRHQRTSVGVARTHQPEPPGRPLRKTNAQSPLKTSVARRKSQSGRIFYRPRTATRS